MWSSCESLENCLISVSISFSIVLYSTHSIIVIIAHILIYLVSWLGSIYLVFNSLGQLMLDNLTGVGLCMCVLLLVKVCVYHDNVDHIHRGRQNLLCNTLLLATRLVLTKK